MSRDQITPLDANWREDYDWREAFTFAATIRTATDCDKGAFTIDDVSDVIAASPGENDGESWMMAGHLKDGRFFFLDAWCDYTGWDCRSGGDAQVANSRAALIRFGMTENGRERLGLPLDDGAPA